MLYTNGGGDTSWPGSTAWHKHGARAQASKEVRGVLPRACVKSSEALPVLSPLSSSATWHCSLSDPATHFAVVSSASANMVNVTCSAHHRRQIVSDRCDLTTRHRAIGGLCPLKLFVFWIIMQLVCVSIKPSPNTKVVAKHMDKHYMKSMKGDWLG